MRPSSERRHGKDFPRIRTFGDRPRGAWLGGARRLGIQCVDRGGAGLGRRRRGGGSSSSNAPPADPNYTKARALIEETEYTEAIPLLRKVVAARPDSADAYNYLGYSHRKIGE